LVILDEPFRGLDRDKRRLLMARTRQYWPQATLICITHDVGQTQGFERVLVIEAGHIAEDDSPANLIKQSDSRYQALLMAEVAVREGLWSSAEWRRLWLEGGQLAERMGAQDLVRENGHGE
jgi:ATP-binding cassette subfamily B protein